MKGISKNNPFKKLHSEDKAGLYVTITAHVMVIIILLISQINSAVKGQSSYLFDFSHIEEEERLKEEAEFKETINRRLDDLINAVPVSPSDIRNTAVDASALKDDRGTDAEALYKDAERLAEELKSKRPQEIAREKEEFVDMSDTPEKQEKKEENAKEYAGPSVVSYSLDGRKARSLSIPAYRCLGGGDVVVIIKVDKAGNVVHAKVSDDAFSSEDECLRRYAVRAARLSKFTASQSASDQQVGEIVYRFIAQ